MGGGNKTTPVTQTTQVQIPPEAQELLGLAMPSLRKFAANGISPGPSAVAGFDPLQTQGQQQVLDAAAGPQSGVVNSAAAANQRMTSGELLDPNSNPALRATIDASTRPIIDDLLQRALPAIRGEATQTGNFGSSRQGIAEGLSVGKAAQAVGDTSAKVATQGYGMGLDALTKGVGLAPSTASASLLPGLATSGVGDVRQALQQMLLGERAGNFNLEQLAPLLVGKELSQIAGGIPGGSTTTNASTAQPNPLLQSLGGAMSLGALGSSIGPAFGLSGAVGGAGGAGIGALLPLLLSDRRAKENVQHIGNLLDGTKIFSYRYKGDPTIYMGFMADSVDPKFVVDINGVAFVHYEAVIANALASRKRG